MKLVNLLSMLAFCAMLPMFSCGSDNANTGATDSTGTEATGTESPGTIQPLPSAASDATGALPDANPQPAAATAGAPGEQHYVCPKNCKGSGAAAAGTCPVCGSAYVHNQAFHAGGANATQTPPPTGATTGANPPPAPAPSPAQNAAGVWHYTCAKGCAGGGGAAGKCASCGGDLAHNAAYHQQ